MPGEVLGEITYPNLIVCADEVWERVSNFILYFIMEVIARPSWDLS